MRKVRKIFDLLESHHTGRCYEIRESLSADKIEAALPTLVLFFEFQFLFKLLYLPLSPHLPHKRNHYLERRLMSSWYIEE